MDGDVAGLARTGDGTREALLDRIAAAAEAEDRGADIGPTIRAALRSGLHRAGTPCGLAQQFVRVAEANLPLARLLEGHVNALALVDRLGGPDQGDRLLGVWGAEGPVPLTVEGDVLRGGKRFASGLGCVERAVVTVRDPDGDDAATQLALVDVTDPRRYRPGAWRMLGMRATASGEIDLTGLRATWLGRPGAYFEEPSFLGGVWRIAACQLGGTLGLLAAARDTLAAAGRLDAPAQRGRLGALAGRAMAAFGLVERAAEVADGTEGREDPERAVALSIQARLLTEDLAQDAVAGVERSVGLAHFDADARTGRIARDLSTYCRQAARDAFEQRAAARALAGTGPLSEFWHG
jgi:hypothetical protein